MADLHINEIMSPALEVSGKPNNDKNNNKEKLRRFLAAFLVILVITTLITIAIYQHRSYNGNISPEAQRQIDSLNKVIGNQKDSIGTYQKAIDDLESENSELQLAKEANQEKIKTIQNEYKKRASNAANYSSGGLDSFFSNRYH